MILETQGLSKQYGTKYAVSNLNLHIKKGEIYGLLGRNGAGKTTTIRLITGLLKPTQGEVILFNEKLTLPTRKCFRRIGALIEAPAFYENLNAKDNLQIIADLRGMQSRDSIKNALELVNLQNEGKKKVRQFSLGMKQRLGIAMALMHEPEFIILDEPTNGLDPVGIQQIRLMLQRLSKENGTTILISSHILSEIEQMADSIGIIDNGCLLEELSMEEIKRRNRHYVKMKVSDAAQAMPIFERELGMTDIECISDREIRVYQSDADFEKINRKLNNSGVGVSEISMNKGNLEEYFMKLTGGVSIG